MARKNSLIALGLALSLSARAQVGPAGAEAQAVRAWDALANKPSADASARVAELVAGLRGAGLSELATLSLGRLADPARTSDAEVRAAAREQLLAAAEKGDSLSSTELLQLDLDPRDVAAHPALAVKLAHDHLAAALLEKPLAEGASFQAGETVAPVLPEGPVQPAKMLPPDARSAQAARDLGRARQIASAIPTSSAQGFEAREVAGLSALAAGDELSAEKEFATLVGTPDGKGSGRSQKALLQLARLAYARGDDVRAERLYGRVGRGASEWLDALFEASWSHFRRGEDERVLGNILTLQAPFFQGRFFPEAFVLQALVLYENCRYADARRALARLEAIFRPRHDALSATLVALDKLSQPSDALGDGRARLAQQLPPQARVEFDRAAGAQDLVGSLAAVVAMTAELDSFDHRPSLRDTAFAAAMLPELRGQRLQLLTSAGATLRARLAADRGELRELLGQSLRLSYEISGRERDQATDPSARASSRPPSSPDVEDDEVMWPFQGEYWRDELGSYRFSLGTRCTPAPRFKKPSSTSANLQP